MNKKKITKIISFLLVLTLLISFPLETQANALAVEPWLIYAMVTYMTAVGFTFTVTGGVEAMLNALEEKANEYSNNVIDFYDTMRQNIKLVPNPNRPPNTDFLNLFFTASGVEAMNSFVEWLVSDGGASEGLSGSETSNMFLSSNDGGTYYEPIYICDTEYLSNFDKYLIHYRLIGEPTIISRGIENSDGTFEIMYNPSGYDGGLFHVWEGTTLDEPSFYFRYKDGSYYGSSTVYLSNFNDNYTYDDIIGFTLIHRNHVLTQFAPAIVFSDNTCLAFNGYLVVRKAEITTINEDFEMLTPQDIIKPLPTVEEGFLMSNVELGSESLDEWANMVEELFIQTGTIPNPQPEIIQDPDFAPEPTPAPTPVPSPEIEDIEDLGLPTLGEAIFNKFPFSLPKDVGRIFKLLHAEPVTPYWQVDLTADALGIPSNFEVDLTEYEVLGQITRWFSVVSYCLFLILITRGMIKW